MPRYRKASKKRNIIKLDENVGIFSSQSTNTLKWKISCFLWIVGLAFTLKILVSLLHNYLKYDSIVTESSFTSETPTFPEITVCAERMHSLRRGILITMVLVDTYKSNFSSKAIPRY